MQMRSVCIWVGMVLLAGVVAMSEEEGAQVQEDAVSDVLHVDVASTVVKSDDADGSVERPFVSLAKAVERARENNFKGVGTRIVLHPGTYRESVDIQWPAKQRKDVPLIIEASEPGKAIVSGSDLWSDGWQATETKGVFQHAWPYKWGLRPNHWEQYLAIKPIALRSELVFADGEFLKQALTPEDLAEGYFCVVEEKQQLLVWLPRNADPAQARMEISVRMPVLRMTGMNQVVLRGLIFQHVRGAVVDGGAAAFGNCRHVLIENCQFLWNGSVGCSIGMCEYITHLNCVANYNGLAGLTAWKVDHLLYDGNTTSYNNWRGALVGFYGWAAGAIKHLIVRHAVYRNHVSVGNQCHSFWFDSGCKDILIDGADFSDGRTDGIFLEANVGPIIIRNSRIYNHRNGPGIECDSTANVILENSILYGNKIQINVRPGKERWSPAPGSTRENLIKEFSRMENWTLRSNVIVCASAEQRLFNGHAWDFFLDTLSSDRNLWYRPGDGEPFTLSGVDISFEEWLAITGQDLSSTFADPRWRDPDHADFEFLPDSPVQTRSQWATREAPSKAGADVLQEMQTRQIKGTWTRPYPGTLGAKATDWVPLDLVPFANRASYGPDGWIGFGNGLTNLPTGRQQIRGVPFDIIEQSKNHGRSIVALKSEKLSESGGKAVPALVSIPVGRKVRAAYVLHGCGWVEGHSKAGQYRFVYEDGTSAGVDVVPLALGSEHKAVQEQMEEDSTIQDWYPSYPPLENTRTKRIIVADLEHPLDDPRTIYTLEWENPAPDKVVTAIELSSVPEVDTTFFVIALTVLTQPSP